jgi:hypothetical protein
MCARQAVALDDAHTPPRGSGGLGRGDREAGGTLGRSGGVDDHLRHRLCLLSIGWWV